MSLPTNTHNATNAKACDQYVDTKVCIKKESPKHLRTDEKGKDQQEPRPISHSIIARKDVLEEGDTNVDTNIRDAHYHRLIEWLESFKGCEAGSLALGANLGCRFTIANINLELTIGPQNRAVRISTVIRKLQQEKAGNTNNRRRSTMGRGYYSLMTRMMKINVILPDVNVRICQGKVVVLESLDISVLQEGRKGEFFDRLRTFVANAMYVEKELKNV